MNLWMGALKGCYRFGGLRAAYAARSPPNRNLPTTFECSPLDIIGVVSLMTGKTMVTLLVWERRYDFPEASRTTGGRRYIPIVAYGGRVFVTQPEWRQRMEGVYLGNTFQEGIAAVEKLLQDI